MHPLKNWPNTRIGYRHGDKTFYGTKHLGTDYLVAGGTPVYAPFDGNCTQKDGPEMGTCLWFEFKPPTGKVILRFGHLSKVLKTGVCKAGDLVAYTGSTGLSTAAHLHMDASRNAVDLSNFSNFIDPETINWNPVDFPIRIKVAYVFNRELWPKCLNFMAEIQDWVFKASGERIWLESENPTTAKLGTWPTRVHVDVMEARSVEYEFFKKNIAQPAHMTIFVVSNKDWAANKMDALSGENLQLQAYTHPVWDKGIQIGAGVDETEMSLIFTDLSGFFDYIRHEIVHGIYKMGQPQGFDFTHRHFYLDRQPELCFNDLDYAYLKENVASMPLPNV